MMQGLKPAGSGMTKTAERRDARARGLGPVRKTQELTPEVVRRAAEIMKAAGRYEDEEIAHVAPGEIIIPLGVQEAEPELLPTIRQMFVDAGYDPDRYVVADTEGPTHRITGLEEFFDVGGADASPGGEAGEGAADNAGGMGGGSSGGPGGSDNASDPTDGGVNGVDDGGEDSSDPNSASVSGSSADQGGIGGITDSDVAAAVAGAAGASQATQSQIRDYGITPSMISGLPVDQMASVVAEAVNARHSHKPTKRERAINRSTLPDFTQQNPNTVGLTRALATLAGIAVPGIGAITTGANIANAITGQPSVSYGLGDLVDIATGNVPDVSIDGLAPTNAAEKAASSSGSSADTRGGGIMPARLNTASRRTNPRTGAQEFNSMTKEQEQAAARAEGYTGAFGDGGYVRWKQEQQAKYQDSSGSIRSDLVGGAHDAASLSGIGGLTVLQDRQNARDSGYTGDWGGGGYVAYTQGYGDQDADESTPYTAGNASNIDRSGADVSGTRDPLRALGYGGSWGDGGAVSFFQQWLADNPDYTGPTDLGQGPAAALAWRAGRGQAPGSQSFGGSIASPPPAGVADRLADLLNPNSDYMRRARSRGLMTANRRGLLNSTMAGEAAEAAALDAALPIAASDAEIANSQYMQGRQIASDQFMQERDISLQKWLQASDSELQLAIQNNDISSRHWIAQLDADTRTQIANLQVGASDREKIGAMIATVQSNYTSMYNNILNNPDLPADQRAAELQHIENVLQNGISLIEQSYGVDLVWTGSAVEAAA